MRDSTVTRDGALVRLREMCRDDVAPLSALLTNPLVTRHQLTAPPGSPEAVAEWMRLMRYRQAEHTAFTFAVTIRGTSLLVGLAQLFRRPARAETEWGWLISPHFWGTGVFLDMCRVLVRFAREELQASELIARASVSNGRAMAALRKLGAQPIASSVGAGVWRTPIQGRAGPSLSRIFVVGEVSSGHVTSSTESTAT